jgi:hypothetical protein
VCACLHLLTRLSKPRFCLEQRLSNAVFVGLRRACVRACVRAFMVDSDWFANYVIACHMNNETIVI